MIGPCYRYNFTITHVRDGDSFKGILDRGFNDFRGDLDEDDSGKVECRQYGINTQEITRSASKGRGDREVEVGFDHRDAFLFAIGVDIAQIPRKVAFHPIPHRQAVIETIRDTTGKYGRLLTVLHYGDLNVNEFMRDIVGKVEFYDKKTRPANFPIRPPENSVYDDWVETNGVFRRAT